MTRDTMTINAFDLTKHDLMDGQPIQIKVTYRFLPGMDRVCVEDKLRDLFSDCAASYRITKYFDGYESDIDSDFIQILEEKSKMDGKDTSLLPIIALGNTDGRFIRQNVYGYTPLLEEDSFDQVLKMVHGHNESIGEKSLIYGTKVLLDTTIEMMNRDEGGC
jgi:acetylornithine deacetylase/succinyl-diaminopimelate desuccinylase-like protein